MHVIVTLIGNPLFLNLDSMSSTLLDKMFDFHKKSYFKIYNKLQHLAFTSKLNMYHHSSLEVLSMLDPLASLVLFGLMFVDGKFQLMQKKVVCLI